MSTPTPESLEQTAAAMRAHKEGKLIEIRELGVEKLETYDSSIQPAWKTEWCEYRPKPEPQRRAWCCPADVPGAVCWLRFPLNTEHQMLISCIGAIGIWMSFGTRATMWSELERDGVEYSTDRITWKPCTVEA